MSLAERNFNTTPYKQGYSSVNKWVSNWVPKTDGGYMSCWMDLTSKTLYTGFSSDLDFLTSNFAMDSIVETTGISVDNVHTGQTSLFRRSDGKVLLIIANKALASWTKCYISNTGNGDDWNLLTTIHTATATETNSGEDGQVSVVLQTSTGRLIVGIHEGRVYTTIYNFKASYIYTSDDNGATWTQRASYTGWYENGLSQACQLPDGTLYIYRAASSGNTYLIKSIDNGDSWSSLGDYSDDFTDELLDSCFWSTVFYDTSSDCAFVYIMGVPNKICYLENPTAADFENKTKWKVWQSTSYHTSTTIPKIYQLGNELIFNTPFSATAPYIYSSAYTPPPSGSCAAFYKSATGWKRIRMGIKI